MRKLTVKNFSVIKEAELEFGQDHRPIGPQSSGKSLLCKLAFFPNESTRGIATSSILNRRLLGRVFAGSLERLLESFLTGPGLVSQTPRLRLHGQS